MRTRLRAASVRHFVDPSLAIAATGVAPSRLLSDLEWFGLLLENLVIRDLRVHHVTGEWSGHHFDRSKVGVYVNNQFGPEQLDVKQPSQLCLPAVVELP